jgi:RNA polymerase sigma-70 factor (ECF subfamily)
MLTDAALESARPVLFGFCLRLTHSRTDAEDLAQDTLIRAWRARRSFRSGASLMTWLSRIAVRLMIDHQRRQAVRPETLECDLRIPDTDYTGPEILESARVVEDDHSELDMLHVFAAIERLVPASSVILGLAAKQQGHRFIAEQAGIPRGTVRSRLHRSRQALVAELSRS